MLENVLVRRIGTAGCTCIFKAGGLLNITGTRGDMNTHYEKSTMWSITDINYNIKNKSGTSVKREKNYANLRQKHFLRQYF